MMDSTDKQLYNPDDHGLSLTANTPMEANQFLTPSLDVDGTRLTFIGPIEAGREVETFATLLTFTTFAERASMVIDEAYAAACAGTGASCRLGEERWYEIAREYFEEYLEQLNSATMSELQHHLSWLDTHFFSRHAGYEGARMVIERFLVTRGGPLH
ncbi:MAG: hypothetical protein Q4B13_07850 [Lautropia sp.]|nr:hypothetical protein [Lautropia sp.]